MNIPAKAIDKPPKFNFAVISHRKGNDTAELESSFVSEGTAKGMFERQYAKWGLTDTNFYLVNWEAKEILVAHIVWKKGE